MTGRERIKALLDNKPADRVGYFTGWPTQEASEIYYKYFEVSCYEELAIKLGNDFSYLIGEAAWKHPDGKPIFDFYGGKPLVSLSQNGIFADCEDVNEVEEYDWPNPEYLDFTSLRADADIVSSKGMAVFSGMWSMFFHNVADFFGMENYFIKMHTNPDVVDAVTERVVNFYLEANKRCFEAMGSRVDAFFFGNDFGSQENLLVAPEQFKRFILPGFKKLINVAKSYNLKVVLHSCGAISKVIPLLIDAGIDGLHPLQAKAKGMEAEKLAKEFKNDLLFIGGVDTQEILPFGTSDQVKAEVRRLKSIFGDRYVVSPSHEAILPVVKPENILAMRNVAFE